MSHEKVLKRNKLRDELKKQGIYTDWDQTQKRVVLYKPGSPGVLPVEVGYISKDDEAIFY